MRKTILGALISSAFALAGPANAALVIDLNGGAAGGVISATALDWAQTSFLAQNGAQAIVNFQGGCLSSCDFNVMTHAKLTGYTPSGGGGSIALPAFGGEITMVANYVETVVSFAPVGLFGGPQAAFRSTGVGSLQFYFSAIDSDDLTGSGFDNGRLIGTLTGVTVGAGGSFAIDSLAGVAALDGFNANDYPGQLTVTGTGSQAPIAAGLTSKTLDPTFFLTALAGFSILYNNISIGLPYTSADPSDCFNNTNLGRAVGSVGNASTCNTTHVTGPYAAQNPLDPGYLPNVGLINGFGTPGVGVAPDFVAQTDFNASVTGIPEPTTLALVGLALGSMGFAARRRRS